MTLLVNSGIGVNTNGRLVVVDSQLNTTVQSPVGNPARTLVVLRPKETDGSNIPLPTNPGIDVPLHKFLSYDLIVLNGTPAASPVYPSKQAGDIIVCGLKLSAGHATIVEADFDLGVVDRPRKRSNKPRTITASDSLALDDDIIEVDFSAASGVLQLPPAASAEGMKYTIIKVDDSGNDLAVSGNGAETISGQNAMVLDTQWQAITIYANRTSWRQI
jgi:hypothetical protein